MSEKKKNNLEDKLEESFYEERRKKIEDFEVNIEDTYDRDDETENLMSYSEKSQKPTNIVYNKHRKDNLKINKSLKNANFFKTIWIFMIVMLCVMIGQFITLGTLDMLAIARGEEIIQVDVPKGSGKMAVADILYDKNIIKQPTFFKLYLLLTKGSQKFIPGSFEIKTNLDYEAIVNYLQSNANRLDSDIIDVTIPEGKNVLEIAGILEENEICSAGEFIEACNLSDFDKDYDFLNEHKTEGTIYRLEGFLFPDTYSFYKNVEPKTVIKKFLNNFNNKISKKLLTDDSNEKVSVKTLASKKEISVNDLINIASLIQAEAANDSDMPGVAAVINNRLKTTNNGGMSTFGDAINGCLSVDATVWYPYRNKEKVPKDIVETYESPYDTYKFKGLPKGPICNPGMSSIESALNYEPTQYYFYCHSKEGKTYYAKTLSEHNNNLRKAGLV